VKYECKNRIAEVARNLLKKFGTMITCANKAMEAAPVVFQPEYTWAPSLERRSGERKPTESEKEDGNNDS